MRTGILHSSLVALGLIACSTSSRPVQPCDESVADPAAFRAALESFGADTARITGIHAVCGLSGVAVTAVWAPERDSGPDYGPRVVVLRTGANRSPHVAFASRGQMDANLPALHVHATGEQALVLADLGNEGSWGLAVFEITQNSVRDLGLLDVGRAAQDSTGDPDWSAAELAHVSRGQQGWRVAFDSGIVLRPNQEALKREVLAKAPAAFEYKAGEWRRVAP